MKKNRRLRNAAEPQPKLERNYFCHDDGGTTAVSSLNFGTGTRRRVRYGAAGSARPSKCDENLHNARRFFAIALQIKI
jgi:hypothetical protein